MTSLMTLDRIKVARPRRKGPVYLKSLLRKPVAMDLFGRSTKKTATCSCACFENLSAWPENEQNSSGERGHSPSESRREENRRNSEGDVKGLSKVKRGLFRRKTTKQGRVKRQSRLRGKYTRLQAASESLETLKSTSENKDICKGLRRRMATCEQLERLTEVGPTTLHDFRMGLVVINRLEDFGLM